MKKLTVSASLLSDARFLKLCVRLGDEEKAIGKMVLAYRLAAEFWWPGRKAIPSVAWSAAGLGSELLEVGLASTLADEAGVSVLVDGLEEQFAWRFHVAGAGSKGGKTKRSSSRAKAKLSCAQAELSPAKAELQEYSEDSSETEAEPGENAQKRTLIEKIYQSYPRRPGSQGKPAAVQKLMRLSLTELEQFDRAVFNYSNFIKASKRENSEFVKMFSSFATETFWRGWLEVEPTNKPAKVLSVSEALAAMSAKWGGA